MDLADRCFSADPERFQNAEFEFAEFYLTHRFYYSVVGTLLLCRLPIKKKVVDEKVAETFHP
jgi:hypothetical protein